MADLIKKIKIKKQDGTFTDYIPIGAEAQNISTNDGDSVQLKLNKKPYYYNNVADMKADTKLKAGDMAITLGYYSANDGGNGEYNIIENEYGIDDGGSLHELENGLFAELIIKNSELNVKCFGSKGDDRYDDTSSLQKAIDFVVANPKYQLIIPRGIYKITNKITIKDRCRIIGTGTNLPVITGYNENAYVEIKKDNNDNFIYRLDIENITFSANNMANYALYCDHINESTFINVEFGYGVICDFYAKKMEISNFYNCRFTNSNIALTFDTGCVNNTFYSLNFWNNEKVLLCIGNHTHNIFNETWFEKWGDHLIDLEDATDIKNLCFNSSYFLQSNSTKTSSNIFTENKDFNYNITFNDCLFLFPFVSDDTTSLFHVSSNSWNNRKFLDIINCSLAQKGSLKSWIDDSNVVMKSVIRTSFNGTKWASIPFLSNNKCALTGIVNYDLSQQGFKQWIALPDNSGDVLSNWPSYKEGTILYNNSTGLIQYKSLLSSERTSIPIIPSNNVIPQSTATDIAGLQSDLNNLISKLYDSKIIKDS